MTYAIITTVIYRVSNLFGDFECDRKSFRCLAMPANIPHRKCVVNTLKLKNFPFVFPLLSAIKRQFLWVLCGCFYMYE